MGREPLVLPRELQELVDRHPHVDWQGIVAEAVRRHGHAIESRDALEQELDDPHVQWASEVLREDAHTLLQEVQDAHRA